MASEPIMCCYCYGRESDDDGPIDVTTDGGREWRVLGFVCARCRDYLRGHWRRRRA